jgi:hypothetical protein
MKSPYRQRRFFALFFAAGMAGASFAQTPPEGRWRCYQPPGYTVVAWFDLTGNRIAVDGNAPQALAIDAATGRVGLPAGALAPHREGLYLPPGSAQGDAGRHTLVLLRAPGQKAGGRGWERLPRCYLTTH